MHRSDLLFKNQRYTKQTSNGDYDKTHSKASQAIFGRENPNPAMPWLQEADEQLISRRFVWYM